MDDAINHENGGSTMLVLTRKSQESVVVGGSDRFQRILKVKVLEIRGDKVKLGFDVEADVPVHRLEVWERIFSNGRLDSPNHDVAAPVK
jgi:carbon storage regulator CsrA